MIYWRIHNINWRNYCKLLMYCLFKHTHAHTLKQPFTCSHTTVFHTVRTAGLGFCGAFTVMFSVQWLPEENQICHICFSYLLFKDLDDWRWLSLPAIRSFSLSYSIKAYHPVPQLTSTDRNPQTSNLFSRKPFWWICSTLPSVCRSSITITILITSFCPHSATSYFRL